MDRKRQEKEPTNGTSANQYSIIGAEYDAVRPIRTGYGIRHRRLPAQRPVLGCHASARQPVSRTHGAKRRRMFSTIRSNLSLTVAPSNGRSTTLSCASFRPPGVEIDPKLRPFIVVDPRAGHGPGIGGFKSDSEIGVAFKAGHPCYFVGFLPDPMPGQTIEDIARAEAIFLEKVDRACIRRRTASLASSEIARRAGQS